MYLMLRITSKPFGKQSQQQMLKVVIVSEHKQNSMKAN